MVMKNIETILGAIKETTAKLNKAKKKDNPLISASQNEVNILHLETKLSTLLFCADLEEIDILLTGFRLGFN